ncbi:MAG: pyridoxal-phosphate dependent enzyme [Xanthomonadales bacterium]
MDEIRAAESRIAGLAVRTPMIRLNDPDTPADIYLKLENLQPVGAFKIRSIGNILESTRAEKLRHGVYTASSGNSGYALAWLAQRRGIPATVYVPESAPEGKCALIRRMGARIKMIPYADWWDIICNHISVGEQGLYIDAVCDPAAIAGNATIGLEILQDLPDVDTVVVPFGGGGVSCGIASAVRALKPDTRVLAAESEMSTPFSSALEAGQIVQVENQPSFISGIGASSVLAEMWPLTRRILDGSVVSSLRDVADAIRILFESNHVVAEGAGATALAGALSVDAGGPIVCVITGGNIDRAHMITILEGGIPAI